MTSHTLNICRVVAAEFGVTVKQLLSNERESMKLRFFFGAIVVLYLVFLTIQEKRSHNNDIHRWKWLFEAQTTNVYIMIEAASNAQALAFEAIRQRNECMNR
jgi:hypothetical protein